MPNFKYSGVISQNSDKITGNILAKDNFDAYNKLKIQGIIAYDISESKKVHKKVKLSYG